MSVTQSEVGSELREPTAAPHPVAKQRIHDGADAATVDHERRESPSLGGAAGRNGCRRIHENHLEQEQSKCGRVIASAQQHKTFPTDDSKRFAEYRPSDLVIQAGVTAHRSERSEPAEHKGET